MTGQSEHATLEYGEQSDRTGADDRHIGAQSIGRHERSPLVVAVAASAAGREEWSGSRAGSSVSAGGFEAEFPLANEAQTAALAARLAALTRAGDVLALSGDLGCGKTAFARAFIRARGTGDEEVPSPTFTLVQVYEPPTPDGAAIWHFDLYRIADPEEAWELGIEEAFATGISLIEWPERLGRLLPSPRLGILFRFGAGQDARCVLITGDAVWHERLHGADLV
ncbi:MAG: tRNA (adenosine(37)-N6)-threonylcarbamoyltransferase complex ATPase subunit type 1 TsaE [Rhodospirillales bacterium]|nr:tRNA (adenosine(37)-N6)-threonylcarbamoyltransferase complex ATPase subunit type 1 TsaE [Rhodospirillales bacterium]